MNNSIKFSKLYAAFGFILAGVSGSTMYAQGGGADTYARYSSPTQCIQAISRLEDQHWRDKRPDTVVYNPEVNPYSALALDGGKACAAKFTVSNVTEKDLLNLALLSWMIGDDQKGNEAAEKLLASPTYSSQEAKTYLLYNLVATTSGLKPARFEFANKYLLQLEGFGKSAARYRALGNFSYSLAMLRAGKIDSSHTLAGKAVVAMREMEVSDKVDLAYLKLRMYALLAEPVGIKKNAAAAMNFLDSAEFEILKLRPQGSRAYEGLEASLRSVRSPYRLLGGAAQGVAADKWFAIQVGDTILPRADVPTFVVLGSHSCGGRCYPVYATLERLQKDYNSKGIKFVLIAGTGGYFRNKLVQPGAEVDSAGGYFTNFLKLPSVVAMTESEFIKIHDGRRRNNPSLNSRNYSRGKTGVLVGTDGVVKLVIDIEPERERVIRQTLDNLYK